jgi:hypothetical protein
MKLRPHCRQVKQARRSSVLRYRYPAQRGQRGRGIVLLLICSIPAPPDCGRLRLDAAIL